MVVGHLILTRYNLTLAEKRSEGLGQDQDWLEHRLRLFSYYTFPSVAAQTVRSFRWLVFIHPDTPTWVKRRLDEDRAAANMYLVETPVFDRKLAVEAAHQYVGRGTTHLLTTTLDNDDALARSFVGQLQGNVRAVDFEVINFLRGFRFVERSGAIYHCQLRSNPFMSAVERLEQARTIWAYLPHHTLADRVRQVRDIRSDPVWLQVVHDRNLAATSAWGWMRARPKELRDLFSIASDVYIDERTGPRVWPENVWRWLERRLINRLDSETRARLRQRVRRWRER
jgi:hypothetical protein